MVCNKIQITESESNTKIIQIFTKEKKNENFNQRDSNQKKNS